MKVKVKNNSLMMLVMAPLWARQASTLKPINGAIIDNALLIHLHIEQTQSSDDGDVVLDASMNVDTAQ